MDMVLSSHVLVTYNHDKNLDTLHFPLQYVCRRQGPRGSMDPFIHSTSDGTSYASYSLSGIGGPLQRAGNVGGLMYVPQRMMGSPVPASSPRFMGIPGGHSPPSEWRGESFTRL